MCFCRCHPPAPRATKEKSSFQEPVSENALRISPLLEKQRGKNPNIFLCSFEVAVIAIKNTLKRFHKYSVQILSLQESRCTKYKRARVRTDGLQPAPHSGCSPAPHSGCSQSVAKPQSKNQSAAYFPKFKLFQCMRMSHPVALNYFKIIRHSHFSL